MEQLIFVASCPICGRVLFKGSCGSYLECGCPKCKEYIKITFTECGFQASVGFDNSILTNKSAKKEQVV